MSLTLLKNYLKTKSEQELIAEIVELYKKHKAVKEHYQVAVFNNEDEIFEKYKAIIENAFFPKRGHIGRLKLSIAKKAISDFSKLSNNQHKIIELMMVYVENGARFNVEYGDINEAFYQSMETVFRKALLLMKKANLLENYVGRIEEIFKVTSRFGWELYEQLSYSFQETFPDHPLAK